MRSSTECILKGLCIFKPSRVLLLLHLFGSVVHIHHRSWERDVRLSLKSLLCHSMWCTVKPQARASQRYRWITATVKCQFGKFEFCLRDLCVFLCSDSRSVTVMITLCLWQSLLLCGRHRGAILYAWHVPDLSTRLKVRITVSAMELYWFSYQD